MLAFWHDDQRILERRLLRIVLGFPYVVKRTTGDGARQMSVQLA